ncbi:MAG: oxidoreductase [Paracoccaceae bacterium]
MIEKIHSRTLVAFMLLLTFSVTPAFAQDGMKLQVAKNSSNSEPIELSIEALDLLEQKKFSTKTIWTDGITTFSGVPLKVLLNHFDANGETVEMVALNDYAVTMPFADLEDDAPIVATRMNGELMSVRDKGPFWVVYPYDLDARYQNETVYSRSIWQLNRLKVMD